MIQTKAIHKITRRFLLLFFILRFLNIIYYHDRPWFIISHKDTTKNWEWGQNGEKSMRMSGLIDLVGFSVKTTDATKKSVEARVALLSRYSFHWRRGLESPWGNGCKLSEYSVSGGKIRVISDSADVKRTKKTWSGCDCTDVLRIAYSLSALHGIILQTKTTPFVRHTKTLERWQSGRLHRSWKPAYWEVPGVRIPLSPQSPVSRKIYRTFFFCAHYCPVKVGSVDN